MQGKIPKIEKGVVEPLEEKLGLAAGICICIVVLLMVVDVLGRYVFHTTILIGIYSINEYFLFPLIIFLGLGVGYRSGIFPRLTFIEERAPAKQKWLMQIVCLAIELILFASVAIYELHYTICMVGERLVVSVGPYLWPIYPVMCIMTLGFCILTIEIALKLRRVVISKPSKQVKEV